MKKKITLLSALILWAMTSLFAQNALTIINPNQWGDQGPKGTIEEARIAISPQGAYMETELFLTISARGLGYNEGEQYEIILNFNLPEGTIMHDSWLWMLDEETIVKADVLDISQASSTYEDIVDRQRDPSILYKKKGGGYQLRIYPLLGGSTRKVKITYLTPAIWSEDKVEVWLPVSIFQSSLNPLTSVEVLTFPSQIWQNPRLEELSGNTFTAYTDPNVGTVLSTFVPNEAFRKPLHFAVDAPLNEDGLFVNHLQDGENNFYQMVYTPPVVDVLPSPKNIVFLFDHSENNVQIDRAYLFEKIKETAIDKLGEEDQFNMLFSKAGGTQMLSNEWILGDEATMEEAFASMANDPIQNYSDLIGLLQDGINFVKDNGGEADIVLFVSSDNFDWNSSVTIAVQELMEQIGQDEIQIHIISYQSLNFSYYIEGWVSTQITYPTHDLFKNLTSATSGQLYDALTGSLNVWESIEGVFSFLKDRPYDYDLHTSLESGFAFQRFHQNYMGQSRDINAPILQIGKYIGNFPLNIEFTAFVDGEFIFDTKVITEEQIFQSDTLLREIWMGNYLPSLEGNTSISEIVELSILERVLTPHTAFLALDLENGGEPCWKCWEYIDDIIFVTTNEANPSDLGINITASPNPFTDKCLLEFELDSGVSYNQLSMQIFDVLGKRIANIDTQELVNFGKMQWIWDGTDQNGSPLSSGMYYLIVKTAKGVQSFKLALTK